MARMLATVLMPAVLLSIANVRASQAAPAEYPGRVDTMARLNELVRAGIRLETELVAIMGYGSMVITDERMWGDFVRDDLAPLRSTTSYVVDADPLVAISRVLATGQRDALTASFAVGTWSFGVPTAFARQFDYATSPVYPRTSASIGT